MNENLKKLIFILQDGNFHSGEHLGKTLGLTRSAIWKLIKQLSAWDFEIESATNKGYRIPGGLSLLHKENILSYLSNDAQQHLAQLEILDITTSTNDYLLNILQKNTTRTYACFAEKQTHGKGRRGRSWTAPFARNIYLSLLWHFHTDPGELSGLSLVVAISIIETLKSYPIIQPLGIKWPNDILANNHKLAGILIELVGQSHDVCSAVIGIGLNIHMPSNQYITQPWTDLHTLTKANNNIIDRNTVAGRLLEQLIKQILLFQTQGFQPFMQTWQALDLTFGKPVSLSTATATLQGIGRGINEQGYFLLETVDGIKSFTSGEVSLRLS